MNNVLTGIVIILIVNIAFAKSIIYDVKSDGKQIGTLSIKIEKLKNKGYKYKTYLKISDTFMFIKYTYEYRENAFFNKNGLLEFTVEEITDGKRKKMHGKREGDTLVFENGKKIKFSQINATPFDIGAPPKYNEPNITTFTLKSFDGLTGELVDEIYQSLGSKKVGAQIHHILEKRNSINDEVETLTITESGELLKAEGEDFEMIFRSKGK